MSQPTAEDKAAAHKPCPFNCACHAIGSPSHRPVCERCGYEAPDRLRKATLDQALEERNEALGRWFEMSKRAEAAEAEVAQLRKDKATLTKALDECLRGVLEFVAETGMGERFAGQVSDIEATRAIIAKGRW